MTALLAPLFVALMSISIVNVALPAIETGVGASAADLQWVLSGYALAIGVALVPAGRAGDLWGRRRFFLLGAGLFGAASLLCAAAPTPTVLNIGRVLMGLGAGVLTPQVIGMIQSLFDGAARGRAYGLMGTVIGAAVAFGPTVGGVLIDVAGDDAGWRLTFLINVPVALAACVLAVLWLPKDARGSASPGRGIAGLKALDPLGVLLLCTGVLLVMVPFLGVSVWVGVLMGTCGVAVMTLWVLWERRLGARADASPMVDLRLFSVPSFTLNSLVLSLYFTGMPAVWAVVAVYVQQGLGYSAVVAGLVTLPSAVMVMALSSSVGRRVERRGVVFLVVGTTAAVASMLLVAVVGWLADTVWGAPGVLAAVVALVGLSQALIIPSAQTLSMEQVPTSMAGAAGGVAQTAQRLATAVGIAVVTAVYFAAAESQGHAVGLVVAALVIAGLLAPAAVTAWLIAHRLRESPRHR